MVPVARAGHDGSEDNSDGSFTGVSGPGSDRSTVAKSDMTALAAPQGYAPVPAKGHKESVYALCINDSGTTLVSGGTEKVRASSGAEK
jgi:WD repeat-containing protein 48